MTTKKFNFSLLKLLLKPWRYLLTQTHCTNIMTDAFLIVNRCCWKRKPDWKNECTLSIGLPRLQPNLAYQSIPVSFGVKSGMVYWQVFKRKLLFNEQASLLPFSQITHILSEYDKAVYITIVDDNDQCCFAKLIKIISYTNQGFGCLAVTFCSWGRSAKLNQNNQRFKKPNPELLNPNIQQPPVRKNYSEAIIVKNQLHCP